MSTFTTSVSCMDGRVQVPIRKWVTERFGPAYIDTITQPGMDGVLAGRLGGDAGPKLARDMTALSVNAHGSALVVVSGHHDCAGNPVSRQKHVDDIRESVKTVKSWDEIAGTRVIGLWVNENWEVEQVT